KKRFLCLHCYALRDNAVCNILFWGCLFFFVPGALFYWTIPDTMFGPIFLNLGLLQVSTFVSILLHELGHAAAGRLAGMKIYGIEIGKGRVFKEFVLAGFRWQFRAVPVGGYAHGATKNVCCY